MTPDRLAHAAANASAFTLSPAERVAKHARDEAERSIALAKLRAERPDLVAVGSRRGKSGTHDSLSAAAANIRREVKAVYPGVDMSVKLQRFSMGNSITLGWTDGPTEDAVMQIVGKYRGGHYDTSEDLYRYNNGHWTAAFGDAMYLSCQRANSDRALESAMRTVFAVHAAALQGVERASVQSLRRGELISVRVGGDSLSMVVHRVAAKRTWTLPRAARVAP